MTLVDSFAPPLKTNVGSWKTYYTKSLHFITTNIALLVGKVVGQLHFHADGLIIFVKDYRYWILTRQLDRR